MDNYFDLVNEWIRTCADPFIYDHLDIILPEYQFRRINPGGPKDHWASHYKINGHSPKVKNPEKTVVYPNELRMREQGEWDNPVGVVDYLQRELGLENGFRVYEYLSDRFALDMPRQNSASMLSAVSKKQRTEEVLNTLQHYFVWNMRNNKKEKAEATRKYLRETRGLTDSMIERLGLGCVPPWRTVITYMTEKKGFTKYEVDAACLVENKEGFTSVGRYHTLSIPYICEGVLKGFQFRRVDGDKVPKYIVNSGLDRKSDFFNMPESSVDTIVVMEGEMDALSATAYGINNAVAIGGSEISGDRIRQVQNAMKAGVTRIFLCPDLDTIEDENGQIVPNHEKRYRAVMRSIHTIHEADIDFDRIYVVEFPEPSDPDEYIRRHGANEFRKLLRSAKPWWEYVASAHQR